MVLEPLGTAHADLIYDFLQDKCIYEYIPKKTPTDLEALRERYSSLFRGKSADEKEEWLNWIAFPKAATLPCDAVRASTPVGKDAGVAFVFFPRYGRQGYGSEATAAMIDCIRTHYN